MAPRSRTGCLTCRQRKLKCSEEKPICAQCVKANRECVPSSGITFRHQQNPSLNGEDQESLKSFYGYKETFGKSTKWVEVPKDLTFVHTSNPYEDEEGEDITLLRATTGTGGEDERQDEAFSTLGLNQTSYPAYATHGLEALSAVASRDYNYTPAAPSASLGQHEGPTSTSQASPSTTSPQRTQNTPSQHLDFILNPTSSGLSPTESNIDPQLHPQTPTTARPTSRHSSSHGRTASLASHGGRTNPRSKGLNRRSAIEDPQLAFHLRDYAERPGFWMDLYDLDLFFSHRVPVIAVTCPLLLYSCASLSAKSLGRVAGRKPIMGGQVSMSRQSKLERWPGPPLDQESWIRRGREYYDIAVSLLRQALTGSSRPPTSCLPEDASPTTLHIVRSTPLPTTDSDELVAATAILCVYEFLDASGPEWSRHLDGAKTLFEITKDKMIVPLTLPPSPVSIAQQVTQRLASQSGSGEDQQQQRPIRGLSQGRSAVFWNFARQDMLSAFINNTSTRLDTGDLHMWRSAGLKLTPDGYVSTSNPQSRDYVADNAMGDDMIGNALVWWLMKLVNFIAAGDDLPSSMSPLGLGVRQQELLEYWDSLYEQLRVWYEGLPDGFNPTTAYHGETESETERWFPRPMCASTMQWYHFAKIQLLHNKPHLSTATPMPSIAGPGAPGTSLASRYASYASILQQSRGHAKEIVAIARGRSDEGTRIHGLQPLWTAGLVLGNDDRQNEDDLISPETELWRRTIVAQLRGIERDMGWACEYRVQSLFTLWGVSPSSWPLSPG